MTKDNVPTPASAEKTVTRQPTSAPPAASGGLDALSRLLVGADGKAPKASPPLEKWNPAYCGEMDLLIKSNGE